MAILVDQSAGVGDLDPITGQAIGDGYDDSDDIAPVVTFVVPFRRITSADTWPVSGVMPGKDPVSGRPWFGWDAGRMVFGVTVDGGQVGLKSVGPFVLEPVDS